MRTGLRRIGAGIALLLAIAVSTAAAPSSGPAGADSSKTAVGRGPLDGMVFVGMIGPENKLDLDDELHFAAGQFWSSNCVACGYQPGAYWTRTVGDKIHFRGVLKSADGGEFEYSGHVVDGRVEVTIHWTQQRWYWSIDRNLAFVGTLAKPPSTSRPSGPAAKEAPQCRRL